MLTFQPKKDGWTPLKIKPFHVIHMLQVAIKHNNFHKERLIFFKEQERFIYVGGKYFPLSAGEYTVCWPLLDGEAAGRATGSF